MFRLYAMNAKGLSALKAMEKAVGARAFESVVSEQDVQILNDSFEDIKNFCTEKKIPFFKRGSADETADIAKIAIGWRWLIPRPEKLLVLHDSLLPRYRGFAPLVSALINGDEEIGVSCLKATEEYDRGPILFQKKISARYPLKLSDAIELILPLYEHIAVQAAHGLMRNEKLEGQAQDEAQATYSLWRDEDDYWIDWKQDAKRLERFVHALGNPYLGAQTRTGDSIYRVHDSIALNDVRIENRSPGKVIFLQDQRPVVVCGSGLLKILELRREDGSSVEFPLKGFRLRFVGKDWEG